MQDAKPSKAKPSKKEKKAAKKAAKRKAKEAKRQKILEADRKVRYSILEGKMTLPKPKPMACPKAPPPEDTDRHYPWPAQVQAFLRDEGIEQVPATVCMERWLASNPRIDRFNEHDSGLSRYDRHRFGLLGGKMVPNEEGIDHWVNAPRPEPPPTWDAGNEPVKAEPSRKRSDKNKQRFVKLWKRAYPKLRIFGIRYLSDSSKLPAFLSDVRFALLYAKRKKRVHTAVLDVKLECKVLPSLRDFGELLSHDVSRWDQWEWGILLRRLARSWSQHSDGVERRPGLTERLTESMPESVAATAQARNTAEDAVAHAEQEAAVEDSRKQALRDLKQQVRLSELPPETTSTKNLVTTMEALCYWPHCTRNTQIEMSGLSPREFYNKLKVIRTRAGNIRLFR